MANHIKNSRNYFLIISHIIVDHELSHPGLIIQVHCKLCNGALPDGGVVIRIFLNLDFSDCLVCVIIILNDN